MKIPEYNNLDEKKNIFNTRHIISSVDELNNFLNSTICLKGFIYRGVCEAKYKNYTSAQRTFMTNDLTITSINIEDLIQKQIESVRREHKSLLSKYYKSLNIFPNDFLYLSIAQHYGGISPLLDFTTDFKTALFFMVDGVVTPSSGFYDIGNYSSLYYVKISELHSLTSLFNEVTIDVSKKINELASNGKIDINIQNDIITLLADFEHFKNNKNQPPLFIPNQRVGYSIQVAGKKQKLSGVFSISNLNIVAQKGCFVFYMPKGCIKLSPFETNLHCVDIHKSLIPCIKEYIRLEKNNIYPNEYEMVRDSYNKALRNILR